MKTWFAYSWVVAVLLSIALLLTQSGCTTVNDWMDSHPAGRVQLVTNTSPWTSTIQENYQLTTCQITARRMAIAISLHDKLIMAMNDQVKDEDLKQVMEVEIRALYEYVDELHTWMSDNCSEV